MFYIFGYGYFKFILEILVFFMEKVGNVIEYIIYDLLG